MKEAPFTIVVDTREQEPYEFKGLAVVRKTLTTGDYSIVGFEKRIIVERKNKLDAWQCAGSERARFERCLERMTAYERRAVVIDCDQWELSERPSMVERVVPATVINSYISWSVKYNFQLYWCHNRSWAERTVIRYFVSYLKHCVGGDDGRGLYATIGDDGRAAEVGEELDDAALP